MKVGINTVIRTLKNS
ncbi:IS1-like element transposase [Salmonella enterica]